MKTTGIDVGPRLTALVAFEGSARRQQFVRALVVEGGAERAAAHFGPDGFPKERCLLAVPGRECVLRDMHLPFRGRDEIDKVLKFEAESLIHSHSIDDVVVDALTVREDESGTDLFLAACPKNRLSPLLDAFKRADVQVERACLDLELLVEAARHYGLFEPPAAEEAAEEGGAAEGGEPQAARGADLLVHLGQASVLLGLVEQGRLVTGRILRLGLDAVERRLAERGGWPLAAVEAAMPALLGVQVERAPAEVAPEDEAGGEVRPAEIPPGLLEEASREFVARLQRESLRFLAGVKGELQPARLLLSGPGAALPDLPELVAAAFDLPAERLDLCRRAGGEAGPECDLACAAGLAAIGAFRPATDFRKEELRFKRRFDVLKLPLALACFLGVFLLFYMDLDLLRGIRLVEDAIGSPRWPARKVGARSRQFPHWTGLLSWIAYPSTRKGFLKAYLPQRDADRILKELPREEPLKRVSLVRNRLISLRKKLERETGYFPELNLQSGLAVLQAFAEAMDKADKDPAVKSFVVVQIHLRVGVKKNDRYLEFKVAFRGLDFREQAAAFKRILQDACGPPGPFAAVREKQGGKPYQDPATPGSEYVFRMTVRPDYGVFQPRPGRVAKEGG